MPSKLNQLAKSEFADVFRDVPSAIFVDFTGVGAEETYELRKSFYDSKLNLRIVKTSLLKVALDEVGTRIDEQTLMGPVGVAYGEDPVQVAKAIVEHRRAFKGSQLKVKGGFLDRAPLMAADVTNLSSLPDRPQLLSMVAGAFAAPLTCFIGVQAEIIRKLLYAFDAIRDKQENG